MAKKKIRSSITHTRSLGTIISKDKSKDIDKLSVDGRVLFEFLALIVDIRYRNTYGDPREKAEDKS